MRSQECRNLVAIPEMYDCIIDYLVKNHPKSGSDSDEDHENLISDYVNQAIEAAKKNPKTLIQILSVVAYWEGHTFLGVKLYVDVYQLKIYQDEK